ncbi:MAG: guanosine-3',5'-bis(diphosphate) 3'-pyrophosphohydrolase [Cardiobacterium sp.]|jgi:hypothetical protein
MSTLEKAIELAANYHAGQTDRGGAPYILHLLAVMMAVDGIEAKTVAVLHDILEDTPLTADDLRVAGFSEAIVEAVLALTCKADESRITAAYRAASNPLARVVKLADVAENLKIERIPQPNARDLARLDEYREVEQILRAAADDR